MASIQVTKTGNSVSVAHSFKTFVCASSRLTCWINTKREQVGFSDGEDFISGPVTEVSINGADQTMDSIGSALSDLTDVSGGGGGGGGDIDPADMLPVEDTQNGAIGTSLKYARGDHSHPLAWRSYLELKGNDSTNPLTGGIYFRHSNGDSGNGRVNISSAPNVGLNLTTNECAITMRSGNGTNIEGVGEVKLAPTIGGVTIFPVAGDITLNTYGSYRATYRGSELLTVNGGVVTGQVRFDQDIEIGNGKKILIRETDENGQNIDLAALFIGDYTNITNPITGEIYPRWPQVDSGNTHIPLNLNHANNPISGKYLTYDVGAWLLDESGYPALGKQVLATFTEGVLQLPAKFFNPVDNGAGKLVIDGVTLQELNILAAKYSLGLYPEATDQSVLTFRATRLAINDATAYFDYNFTKVVGDTLERYVVSVSGPDQTTATQRCDKTVWQIGQIPVPFYEPYGSSSSPEIPILDSGINLQINYKNASTCSVSLAASNSDVQTNTIYRTSLVNGAPENTILQNQLIGTTPVIVDADVYSSATDSVTVKIWVPGTLYIVEIFGVGNGFAIGEVRKIHS